MTSHAVEQSATATRRVGAACDALVVGADWTPWELERQHLSMQEEPSPEGPTLWITAAGAVSRCEVHLDRTHTRIVSKQYHPD